MLRRLVTLDYLLVTLDYLSISNTDVTNYKIASTVDPIQNEAVLLLKKKKETPFRSKYTGKSARTTGLCLF